jgi:outer membrane receptor protein involved in Fe transport
MSRARLVSRHTAARLLLAFLLLQPASPLAAQQPSQPPPKTLGEVTLFGEEQPKVEAATKTEIPLSKAPNAVTVITAKQIRESGAKTVPDLLRLVPGVNVRWNPMGPTIDVRGFGESPRPNRILLLIDGVPTNSGDTGGLPLSPAYDLFPVQLIKRIEIVKGPGSALYGENAYWGVINIVTLNADDVAGAAVELYGGGNNTELASAIYGNRLRSSSLLVSVRLQRTEFPILFWHDDGSQFHANDVFLKGGHQDWQFSFYRHDDRMDGFVDKFGPPAFAAGSQFASAHQLQQELDIASLKYTHERKDEPFSFSGDLSYSHRDGMHCAGCHAAQQKPEFSQTADHGYQLIGDFRMGVHMIPGHDILVGVEGRRLDRADEVQELSSAASAVTGYNKLAVYLQDQISLLKDRLRLVAGLRYDGKTSLFPAKTSPRLSAVYTPTDRLVLRAGYGTAFRFPNFSELYQASWFLTLSNQNGAPPAFPLAVFKPDPTLMPEEIQNLDLGGEYQISPTVSAKVDLYRSRVKNFLVIGTVPGVNGSPSGIEYFNQKDQGTITGSEVELRTNLTRWLTGFANYAYENETRDNGTLDPAKHPLEFVYASKNKVNVGTYLGPFAGVRGSIEYAWKGSYVGPAMWYNVVFHSPVITPLPSYGLLGARASYDLPSQVTGKVPVRLSLVGNNLLNKQPRETLLGVDTRLIGRQVFGQVEMHF